jgi:hypothetical protein
LLQRKKDNDHLEMLATVGKMDNYALTRFFGSVDFVRNCGMCDNPEHAPPSDNVFKQIAPMQRNPGIWHDESHLVVNPSPFVPSFLRRHRLCYPYLLQPILGKADQLLKNVLVRFTATVGSSGVTTLSLAVEAVVVEELERRVFCMISMSLTAVETSELSGIVSGATVEADQVACW